MIARFICNFQKNLLLFPISPSLYFSANSSFLRQMMQ